MMPNETHLIVVTRRAAASDRVTVPRRMGSSEGRPVGTAWGCKKTVSSCSLTCSVSFRRRCMVPRGPVPRSRE